MFGDVRNLLTPGDDDIAFGQLKTVITERGAMSPNARLARL